LKQAGSSPACSPRQKDVDCQSENSRHLPSAVQISGQGAFLFHVLQWVLEKTGQESGPKTLHSILNVRVDQAGIPQPQASILASLLERHHRST